MSPPVKAPSTAGRVKPAATPPEDNWSRGGGGHSPSPPGAAAEHGPSHGPSRPLAGMRQSLSSRARLVHPSAISARTRLSAAESCSPCPLPQPASRACHIPTFTGSKKGDPEPGLVGVPSSHSSRRNTSSSSRTLSKRPIASSSSSMAAGAAEGKQEAGSTQQ